MVNSYPANQGLYHPPPEAYHHHPPNPLPPGPPPQGHASQMYQFGMEQQSGSGNPQTEQFNFQSSNQLPSYPEYGSRANRYRDTRDVHERRDYDRRDRDGGRPQFQRRVRMAADRPLLHARRERTPEQFDGMQHDHDDIPKYRNVDTMSDSDSEDMEESESEGEDITRIKAVLTEGKVSPKWSNPEPYTSLPPPEASKKRKDVVKLIRKARIAASKEQDSTMQLAQNDDFISFKTETEVLDASRNSSSESNHVRRGRDTSHNQETFSHQSQDTTEVGKSRPMMTSIPAKLASHKRKRSIEDVVDEYRALTAPKRVKRIKVSEVTGEILPEWVASQPESSTPWAEPHHWTGNSGFRLHKEICDFYEYVRPHDYEQTMRLDLLSRIRSSIQKIHPNCQIHAFGSFAAGLYLPDADIDLVLVSHDFATRGIPQVDSSQVLFKLADHLVREGLATRGSMEIITKAKVPLVKFKEELTGIRVDISFENLTGPTANATFIGWRTAYPAMPILVTVIKQFLLMRGLNEVVNGGIGGFSVTCLVTALLQNMPRVQSGELVPEHHLGEVLLEFLDLYGNQFDLFGTAIELNPPRFVDKAKVSFKEVERREDRLHIVDPNDRTNDISGGSRRASFIFQLFSYARSETLRAMRNKSTISLLDWMLGGNYQVYTDQRKYLRQLYKAGKWESFDLSNEERILNDLLQQTRYLHRPTTATAKEPPCQDSKAAKKKATSISIKRAAQSTSILEKGCGKSGEGTDQELDTIKQTQDVLHNKELFRVGSTDLPARTVASSSDLIMDEATNNQNVKTDSRSNGSLGNVAILVFTMAEREHVRNIFSAHHRSHILTIVRTEAMRRKQPVFKVVFKSAASAESAFDSIPLKANKFCWCPHDLDLTSQPSFNIDECRASKSDAIRPGTTETRKRKATTAIEEAGAAVLNSSSTKRQRRETAPSPRSITKKNQHMDLSDDTTQAGTGALERLCKVVAESLTPSTLSRVKQDIASTDNSTATLMLSRQQIQVMQSFCQLALGPRKMQHATASNAIPLGLGMQPKQTAVKSRKSSKTKSQAVTRTQTASMKRSQELCMEFPTYASSIPDTLGPKQMRVMQYLLKLLEQHPGSNLPQFQTTDELESTYKDLTARMARDAPAVKPNKVREMTVSISQQLRTTYPEFAQHVPDAIRKMSASRMERIFVLLRQCPNASVPAVFNYKAEMELRKAVNETRLERLVENCKNEKPKSPFIKTEPADSTTASQSLQAIVPGPFHGGHGFPSDALVLRSRNVKSG